MNTKEKAQWLANFYGELAENNNGCQYFSGSNLWQPTICRHEYPDMNVLGNSKFRVNPPKPLPAIIDLSMMAGSGILHEFYDNATDSWQISRVSKVYKDKFYNTIGLPYYRCRIMIDHWHSWQGDKCPIPLGLIVKLRYRHNGEIMYSELRTTYNSMMWTNVIAFKVIGPADNYCYKGDKQCNK